MQLHKNIFSAAQETLAYYSNHQAVAVDFE